jgi:hypothetical protein
VPGVPRNGVHAHIAMACGFRAPIAVGNGARGSHEGAQKGHVRRQSMQGD